MGERAFQLGLVLLASCGASEPRATQVVTLAPPISGAPLAPLATVATTDVADAAPPDPEPAEEENTGGFGVSGFGTSGSTYSGTGLGRGTGLGWSPDGGTRHYPTIRANTGTVSVGLPLEIVRRIVRRSFGRIRYCYERGLQKDPKLQGRITVKFVIDPSGKVTKASKGPSTTLPDADVVQCVVRSFESMLFPRPQGGAVVVDYPIDFAP